MRIVLLTAVAFALSLPSAQAAQVVLQPGQSVDAACDAAAPGDTILLAAGRWPSQSVSCTKAAPGVVIQPATGAEGKVVIGNAGAVKNCLNVTGTNVTVRGLATSYANSLEQCGASIGRGSRFVRHESVDAGELWIAADDITISGGDYGPTNGQPSKISETTNLSCGFGCMPRNVLIDGALFHDHRREGTSDHTECISLDGGIGVTIRNSTFDDCAVFHLFISGPSAAHYKDILIEGNRFTCSGTPTPVSMSNAVKFSNHGARFEATLRNNVLTCQEYYVAGSSLSHILFEGNTGRIDTLRCTNCGPGTYTQGETVVTIRSAAQPPPPPPPANAAPTACFTRTPNPSRAGETVTFNASCSTDPDGDSLTYTWDIAPGGDGVYERSGATVSYAYTSTGQKTARLRVNDGHGHVVGTSQTFTVGQ